MTKTSCVRKIRVTRKRKDKAITIWKYGKKSEMIKDRYYEDKFKIYLSFLKIKKIPRSV